MAEINEHEMKCEWSVQCVHESDIVGEFNVRGNVRLSRRMKD